MMQDTLNLPTCVAGYYKIESYRVNNSGNEIPFSRKIECEFENIITDYGLNQIGTLATWLTKCTIGSGTTPPTTADQPIESSLWLNSSSITSVASAQSSSPYYASRTKMWRFNAGLGTGLVSEVGISINGGSSSDLLFSRSLLKDSLGNPMTLDKLSDMVLEVTYEFRSYPPTSDATGTVVLDGVTYNWTARALDVTNSAIWAAGTSGTIAGTIVGGTSAVTVYDGALGAITATAPSGSSTTFAATPVASAYVNGSYERNFTLSCAKANGNLAAGISALTFQAGICKFQYGFSPAIPKTNTKVLVLNVKHSWARKTL
jgi:hypothetical protein